MRENIFLMVPAFDLAWDTPVQTMKATGFNATSLPPRTGKAEFDATSPGLRDAMVEITSLGEPKYSAGKTLPVKPRPYLRYCVLRYCVAQGNSSTLTLGMNNPTRVNSEASSYSGRLAKDGSQATFSPAEVGDPNAWLRLDLERSVNASKTKLTFPDEGNWRCKIELSDDGESNWKLVTDQTQTEGTAKERADMVHDDAPRGRFLRVMVSGVPAGQAPAIVELELTGTMN